VFGLSGATPSGTTYSAGCWTATYTFDDTQGVELPPTTSSGVVKISEIEQNGSSSPGTSASLVVNPIGTLSGTPATCSGSGSYSWGASSDSSITMHQGSQNSYDVYYAPPASSDNYIYSNVTNSGGTWPSNGDWRQTFSDTSLQNNLSYFTAYDGTNWAYGELIASNISVSGYSSCSNTVTLSLDTSDTPANGGQPNLLFAYGSSADTTTIGVSAASGTDVAMIGSYGTFSPSDFATSGFPGSATTTYTTGSGTGADGIEAMACGSVASGPIVYDYNKNLTYSTASWEFDFHQSQVSASEFTTNALTQAQIQTFISNNWSSAMVLKFYIDTTTPGNGGWYDPSGTGATTETFPATQGSLITYCPSAGNCPATGDAGTLVSEAIYNAAVNAVNNCVPSGTCNSTSPFTINDEVLLATMQKESGLVQSGLLSNNGTTFSSGAVTTLNGAFNSGSLADFGDQLTNAAQTFASRYNDTVAYFDNSYSLSWPTPFFWPVNASSVNNSLQYIWYNSGHCTDNTLQTSCALVAFNINNAQTYAQYEYTPFVNVYFSGPSWGGEEGFEQEWLQYSTLGWH
jgi:hypothetical protein